MNTTKKRGTKPPKFRLSYSFTVPGISEEKCFHNGFSSLKEAKRAYKVQWKVYIHNSGLMGSWRICINRVSDPAFINPIIGDAYPIAFPVGARLKIGGEFFPVKSWENASSLYSHFENKFPLIAELDVETDLYFIPIVNNEGKEIARVWPAGIITAGGGHLGKHILYSPAPPK